MILEPTQERLINTYAIFYKDHWMALEQGDVEAAERTLQLLNNVAEQLSIAPIIKARKKAA